MEESKEQADRAVGIINGLQEKGVISFNEDGKCNIIGNAHEQEEDPEQEWVRMTQFEWCDELSG